jgi:hypothetical protein
MSMGRVTDALRKELEELARVEETLRAEMSAKYKSRIAELIDERSAAQRSAAEYRQALEELESFILKRYREIAPSSWAYVDSKQAIGAMLRYLRIDESKELDKARKLIEAEIKRSPLDDSTRVWHIVTIRDRRFVVEDNRIMPFLDEDLLTLVAPFAREEILGAVARELLFRHGQAESEEQKSASIAPSDEG